MRVLIAGRGLAAQRCAETLRARGHDGPITVLCAEPHARGDRRRSGRLSVEAARACPAGAIVVIDSETGDEVPV
jgi:NADPH-dependent 2,4-dienoyl-CoA reductase/sulfur reductase-like enzyme